MHGNADLVATRNSLRHSLSFHLEYARRLVADLPADLMTAVPGPGLENHPAFTLGHLVTGLDLVAQDLGLASDLLPGWADLFLRRGPADRRLPSGDSPYPSRELLLAELSRHTDRVGEAIDRAEVNWLIAAAEPWKLSNYLPTNLDVALFMVCAHPSLHLGQLAAWRRAMGLPAAMASM